MLDQISESETFMKQGSSWKQKHLFQSEGWLLLYDRK